MSVLFLVDDSRDIRDSLGEYLTLNNFKVIAFSRAEGVIKALRSYNPDLVILDIMLPEGDGFSLAETIRSFSRVPIIFLTALESEKDRIRGFELGGDDYVVKPFSMREFVLRVEALLRRTWTTAGSGRSFSWSEWVLGKDRLMLEADTLQMIINGEEISLTLTEWRILKFLMSDESAPYSRDEIISECTESIGDCSHRTVDTHIKNIRSKMGNSGWIHTVRGVGYRFRGTRR